MDVDVGGVVGTGVVVVEVDGGNSYFKNKYKLYNNASFYVRQSIKKLYI